MQKAVQKVKARGSALPRKSDFEDLEQYPVKEPSARGRRKTKRPALTTAEKIQIINKVMVQHEYQADVARRHRITPSYVSWLYNQAIKNRGFLDDKLQAEDAKSARRQQIKDVMDTMVK